MHLFQRFAEWVCAWAGHCRDWPEMETCGRCGCCMPLDTKTNEEERNG